MAAARDEIKVVQFHKFLDFPIPIPEPPPDTHRLAGYGWAATGEPRGNHNTAFAPTLTEPRIGSELSPNCLKCVKKSLAKTNESRNKITTVRNSVGQVINWGDWGFEIERSNSFRIICLVFFDKI